MNEITEYNNKHYKLQIENGLTLQYIPKHYQTLELTMIALKKNINQFEFVLKQYKTKELCQFIIKQNPSLIQDLPKKYKTKEFCKEIIKKYKLTLKFIPNEEKIKQKKWTIKYTLEKNKMNENWKQAIKKGLPLENVPEEYKTQELCEMALDQNNEAFKFMPEKYKTKKICGIALRQNPSLLQYVPEKYKTEKFYKLFKKLLKELTGEETKFLTRPIILLRKNNTWKLQYLLKNNAKKSLHTYEKKQ